MGKTLKIVKKKGLNGCSLFNEMNKMKPGEIISVPAENVNVPTLRTTAGIINSKAGYTKISVSLDSLTQCVRIVNND